jgi:hypothetical protein
MDMIPGLYKASFSTPYGSGSGVVHVQSGQLHGGDSMMMYVGGYSASNGNFKATVKVNRHTTDPNMISVFGIDDFSIDLVGQYDDHGNVVCAGTSPQAPGVNFKANLLRLAA